MKKYIFLAFAALTLGAWTQGQPVSYENHKFDALVGNIRVNNTLVEQGKKVDDIVSAEVPAVLFDPPLAIDSKTPQTTGIEEVDFFSLYLNANLIATKDELLSYWEEKARANKKSLFNDEEMFKKNREIALKNTNHKIIGLVKQGDTVDVLWQYSGDLVIGVPMKKIDGKWQLLSAPLDDLQLAIIESSFMKGPAL